MKLSLEKKIYLGFALALLILIIIVTASAWSLHQLTQANKVEEVSIQQVTLIISLSSFMAAVVVIMTIVVINTDITKRRHFEEALQESEARFRATFEEAAIGMNLVDLQGRTVTSNPAFQKMIGYTLEELRQMAFTDFTHPDDAGSNWALFQELITGKRGTYQLEKRYIRQDGQVIWVRLTASLVYDEQKHPLFVVGMAEDVSDRKRAEQALRASETRFRTLAVHAPVGIFETDSQGKLVFANQHWYDLAGMTSTEALNQGWTNTLHPDDRERVFNGWTAAASSGQEFALEYRFQTAAGNVVWVFSNMVALRNEAEEIIGYLGTVTDITESKQVGEILAQRAAQLVLLNDISSKIAAVLDLDSVLNRAAELVQTTFGYHHVALFLLDNKVARLKAISGSYTDYFPPHHIQELDQGIIGWVGTHNEKVVANDVSQDPRYISKIADKTVTRAELCLPIQVAGQTVGILDIQSPRLDAFSLNDIILTDILVAQIAVAIENARLYQAVRLELVERKQAEEALAQERNLLRAFVDNMPDSIYVKDTASRFIMANRAVAEVMGEDSPNALIGKTDFDFYPEAMAAKFYADEQAIIKSGYPMINYEERVLDRSLNEEHWHLSTKVPFHDSEGHIIGLVGLSRDISKSKQIVQRLRESEERTRLIIENALDAVITINAEGKITQWNLQAEHIFGWTAQETLGQRLASLIIPPEDRLAHEEGLKRFLISGEGSMLNKRIEVTALHRHGHTFPVEVSITPARSEGGLIFSAFIRDITRRKQVEAAMKQAKDAAEAATRAKSSFLANMSHEIRTPLNAIIGMTSLLLDTPLSPDQQEFAETVRLSGDTLLTIINDILDFSKIEAGKLELEAQPFDLRQSIEQALDLVAVKAAEKKLELAYLVDEKTPGAIVGDVVRLRQILVNLLSNAVKFTDAGEVIVTVTSEKYQGVGLKDRVSNVRDQGPGDSVPMTFGAGTVDVEIPDTYELHFAIRDTGLGISKERMDRLFQAFSQVDASTTRKYGGTGLGLAISSRLCQLMGGKLWVESTGVPGQGSTFHFTLWAAAAPSQPRIFLRGQHSELLGKRLLIIDDNATNRLVLRRQAQTWGMSPTAVATGAQALELLRLGHAFDLVILDMQMPEMDGLTLAAEIRRLYPAQTLPLVMLTSLGKREVSDPANEVTFAAVLSKPIKSSQLYDALVGVFNKKQPIKIKLDFEQSSPFDVQLGQRHPLRILLAEDNIVNQRVAQRFLDKLGYQADVAANGLEVIAALERQPYDVILMDMQMPEMDGLEATRLICQKWPETQRPQIIAMTANVLQGDRELCLEAGMDDYIGKPVRIEELVRALSESYPRFGPAEEKDTSPQPKVRAAQLAPTLDLAALGKLRDILGDQAIPAITELINLFIDNGLELLEKMRTAVQAGQAMGLYRGAHTLKPGSAHLGAMRLAALCSELEKLGKANQFQEAAAKLAELEAEFGRVRLALEAERGK